MASKRMVLTRAAVLASSLYAGSLHAVAYTWNVNANGNWSVPGNWTPAGPPNAAADTADFGAIITASRAVSLDISPTVNTISFDNGNNYVISAIGANNLILTGVATINVTNASGNGAHSINAPITLAGNMTLTQNSTGTFTLGGVISGAFSLDKSGPGAALLSAVNTYSTGTTITAGVLQAGIANAFPTNGNLTVTAGTADLNNFNQTVGNLSGAGAVSLGSATLTVSSGAYTGVMSGTGSLVKTTAGVLTLSGANTYQGGTTVNNGTLQTNAVNTLPAAGNLTITAPGLVDFNGNNQTIAALSGSGNLTLGAAVLTTTTSQNTTYSGVISGATGSLVVGGPGTLTLTTPSTFGGGVTISGGVLQAGVANVFVTAGNENITVNGSGTFDLNNFNQTIGTLAGSGAVTLGTATLTLDSTTNSAFSGTISGSGSLIKTNTSTLTLSGTSSYTGSTTVNNGILQAGAANAFPSVGTMTVTAPGSLNLNNFDQTIGPLDGNGNIALGSALLVVDSNINTDYGGQMSGTGSFAKDGTGTLTLSNTNLYTGGTTVIGGVLQAGVVNALPVGGDVTISAPAALDLNDFNQSVGALSGDGAIMLGTANLTTNTAQSTTFSGPISETGSLTKQGTGTLTLLGPNTYSGGTTVTAGTLAGNTTSLQGAIANAATVIFDQPFNGTFNGTLTGAGTLVKNGPGAVTLNGAQTQGNTQVNGGTLTVNGMLTSPLTVAPGGTLNGNGSIVGAVVVGGRIQPGGVPGTLTVFGDYTQGTGSVFEADLSSNASDLLSVMGPVVIQPGGTFTAEIQPGIYNPTTIYTVISSAEPILGQFSNVQVTSPFFSAELLYTIGPPGFVRLGLSIIPFSNVIQGGNAGAVAACFNPSTFSSSSDFLNIVQNLLFLPVEEVADALDKMQPSQMKGLVIAEENNFVSVRTAVQQRLGDQFYTECNLQSGELFRASVWTDFHGDYMDQHNEEKNPGFRAKSGTAAVGVDTRFAKDAVIGAVGAYNTTSLTWDLKRGHGTIDSFYAGPYLGWYGKNAYINVTALGTWNVYNAVRDIDLSFLQRKARSDHHGMGFLTHADLGLLLQPARSVTLGPFGSVDYIYLHERGFTEKNADSLNTTVHPSHNNVFRYEAGLQIAKCSERRYVKWVHHLKASWVYEQRVFGEHYKASFVGQNCSFTVTGLHPDRNIFDVATGLTALFADDHGLLSLIYEGQFGQGVKVQSGSLQFTYRF